MTFRNCIKNIGFIFIILFCASNTYANKWVIHPDSTSSTSNKAFRTLDTCLEFLFNHDSDASNPPPDTIVLSKPSYTYVWNYALDKQISFPNTTVKFMSATTNPDSFPVLNFKVANGEPSLFSTNNVNFERICFTGTQSLYNGSGAATTMAAFKQCVIQGYTASNFFNIDGNKSQRIVFENCLFINNTRPIFRINVPNRQILLNVFNCTFDKNDSLFDSDLPSYGDSIKIVNCILSNNTVTFPGNVLKGKTTKSLTTDAISGYGAGCIQGDPKYIKTTRSVPSDWRISMASPAVDTISGSIVIPLSASINDTLKYDIGTQPRNAGGRSDLGCWELQNHPPTNISLSSTTLPENSTNLWIGKFATTDVDPGETFAYSFVSGGVDNSFFNISHDSLFFKSSPDFETKSSYSISVKSVDHGGESTTKTFSISVTNINEAPTDITLSDSIVNENAAIGTFVSKIKVTDPDTGNTFTGSLNSTGDYQSFYISHDSLFTNVSFDYEAPKTIYSVTIKATDQGGLSTAKTFAIYVKNVNEPPSSLSFSGTTVMDQSLLGTAVGTLSAADPDSNDVLTYSLVSGDGSTDNALFSITGNTIKTGAPIDYLTKNVLSIRVQVTDKGGLAFAKKFTINVLSVPKVVSEPKDAGIIAGQQAVFTVTDTGTRPITYQWYKSGIAIASTTPNCTTALADADGSTYYCILHNLYGEDTTKVVSLNIVSAPVITAEPRDTMVNYLSNAQFTVGASGKYLHCQWYVNNVASPNDTNLTIILKSVAQKDSNSVVKCIVSNIAGQTISKEVHLYVQTPATIITDLESKVIPEGDSTAFAITAIGSGKLNYKWFKNGALISGTDTSSLKVYGVKADSGSSYYCIVANTLGNDTSLTVQLHVGLAKPVIIKQPVNMVASDYDSTKTSVKVWGSIPFTYKWYRVGNENPISTTDTLKVTNIIKGSDEQSKYFCIITNTAGAVTTDTVSLLVNAIKPTILKQPDPLTAYENNNARFIINAKGTVPLSYAWYRSGSTGVLGVKDTLIISNVNRDTFNNTKIYCVITNEAGQVSSNQVPFKVLNALAGPQIIAQPTKSQIIFEGDSVTLSISAIGNPLPTYQWKRNGVLLPGKTDSILIIKGLTIKDYSNSNFVCVITNSIDSAISDTAYVTVELRPKANFLCTPTSGKYPLSVAFTDQSVGTITARRWSFGDDSISTQQAPIHLYSKKGQYSVKLFVSGSGGSDSITMNNLIWAYEQGSNPVRIQAQFLRPSNLQVTYLNLSDVNTVQSPKACSLSLWIKKDSLPSSAESSILLKKYSSDIFSKGSKFIDTIQLTFPVYYQDSIYGLMNSIYSDDKKVTAFVKDNGCMVLMRDTASPDNQLTIAGAPIGKDSSTIKISGISYIDTNRVDTVGFWYGLDTNTNISTSLQTKWFSAKALIKKKNGNDYSYTAVDSMFTANDRTIWCSVVSKGLNGKFSKKNSSFFVTQQQSIQNPIVLKTKAVTSDSVVLSWNYFTSDSLKRIMIIKSKNILPVGFLNLSNYDTINKLRIGDTLLAFSGLNAQTKYYFGAIVQDIHGNWSAITDNSYCVATTNSPKGDSIVNVIKINRCSYDTISTAIKVVWNFKTESPDSFRLGLTYSTDSTRHSVDSIRVINSTKLNDSTLLYIPQIQFNTSYFVGMWLTKIGSGIWSKPTDSSNYKVTTPSFCQQTVTFFSKSNEVVKAFNGTVQLWPGNSTISQTTDTIKYHTITKPYPGYIMVNSGFYFAKHENTTPFNIGLTYSSADVPAGYKPSQIRMYEDYNGVPKVEYLTKLDTINKIVYVQTDVIDHPFMLLIDTIKPIVTFSDTSKFAYTTSNISDTFSIDDNTENVKWEYRYSKGDNSFSLTPVTGIFEKNGAPAIVNISSASKVINSDNGVRISLILTDGTFTDTINCSRRVFRENSDVVKTFDQKWFPLFVTGTLKTNTAAALLSQLKTDTSSKALLYDQHYVRMFRWCPIPANSNTDYKWVEYSDSTASLFTFDPGKVIWIKTSKPRDIDFGQGYTMSLRDSLQITIPPQSWYDIGMPYHFSMNLADIINSTKSGDSLLVYKWSSNQSDIYTATQMYVPKLLNFKEKNLKLEYTAGTCFSFYNPLKVAIVLKIPPVPYTTQLYKKATVDIDNSWYAKISCKVDDNTQTPDIYYGYSNEGSNVYYPTAPSFLNKNIALYDRSTNKTYGISLTGNINEGGIAKEFAITNNSDTARIFSYSISHSENFPSDFKTIFYNPTTKEFESSGSVKVGAHSTEYRYALASNASYINNFIHNVAALNYSLGMIYPNPCRTVMNIPFTVPLGSSDKIDFEIFDQLGRIVWKKSISKGLSEGHHTVQWNGTSNTNKRISAGMYLIRFTSSDERGKITSRFQKQITYLP